MRSFFSRRRADREPAERIYAAAVQAARNPALFRDYGVPDTLQGRFESVALHLFPVLHRLMHQPGDDPALARSVAESFVAHTDGAFREMGVGDTVVPKRMKGLYGSFAGRIEAYKRALEDGDEALVDAIARNVFPDGGEGQHARALARYLREAEAAMRAVGLPELRAGDLPFPVFSYASRATPRK